MAPNITAIHRKRCLNCQFEADAGDDQWLTVSHPPLGTLTQCPECGSTNIHSTE